MSRMQSPNFPDVIDVARILSQGLVAQVEYFDSIDSTHNLAHLRARESDVRLPLLVLAESQTAGRGRGQNRWWTGGGSLALSLVFDPPDWGIVGELPPQRSLAVGVGIIDAVSPFVDAHRVGLHWPNDVFVGSKKLAGILVDVLAGGRHVVGIGLNVNNSFQAAPEEVASRATSMCELVGQSLDRTRVVCDVLCQLQASLRAAAAAPLGFGERFDRLCLQIGEVLTIDVAGQRTSGRCMGIAPDGGLLLETSDGPRAFYSGSLVHG